MLFGCENGGANEAVSAAKPKVIVMTDGEIDDHSSMIRFLLYASDMDVQAIIETNSIFQRHGHSDELWYENQLDAYAKIYPNLIKHHPDFPSAEKLKAISYIGDEDIEHLRGLREKRWEQVPGREIEYLPNDWPDTPGSDAIVEILLRDDPSPIYIQAWGGGNTALRAFYQLKQDHPDDHQRALSKVTMYNIWYQDDAGNYIETHFPEVTMIYCGHFAGSWNYRSQPNTEEFITNNVKNSHGPLGELYPQSYISEGDSPAFFYTINNGLRNHEHPGFGGWGGRFKQVEGFERVFIDDEDVGGKKHQFKRWVDAVNRDYQARMDWCVAERFADANHAPIARVSGDLRRIVKPGETISLDASASSDPDGDTLNFRWWQYLEAGSAKVKVNLSNAGTGLTIFEVPDEPGKQLHIILEVTDNGVPSMTHYQRIICNIEWSKSPETKN